MLDVRYSHLYFYQSLYRLQRGLSAIAELLVNFWMELIGLLITKIHSHKMNVITFQGWHMWMMKTGAS